MRPFKRNLNKRKHRITFTSLSREIMRSLWEYGMIMRLLNYRSDHRQIFYGIAILRDDSPNQQEIYLRYLS